MSIQDEVNEKIFVEAEKPKEKIFNAAVDLFFTKGFHKTSIRDIANATGMNSAGIYHHFGNKEGLLLFILEQTSQSLLMHQKKVLENAKGLNPLDRFKIYLNSAVQWTLAHPKESKIFLLNEAEISSDGVAKMNRLHQGVVNTLYDELANLERAGYIKRRNLKLLCLCTEGVLEAYTRYYKEMEDLPAEKLFEEIASFILAGIFNTGF